MNLFARLKDNFPGKAQPIHGAAEASSEASVDGLGQQALEPAPPYRYGQILGPAKLDAGSIDSMEKSLESLRRGLVIFGSPSNSKNPRVGIVTSRILSGLALADAGLVVFGQQSREDVQKAAELAGRSADVIVIGPEYSGPFNLIGGLSGTEAARLLFDNSWVAPKNPHLDDGFEDEAKILFAHFVELSRALERAPSSSGAQGRQPFGIAETFDLMVKSSREDGKDDFNEMIKLATVVLQTDQDPSLEGAREALLFIEKKWMSSSLEQMNNVLSNVENVLRQMLRDRSLAKFVEGGRPGIEEVRSMWGKIVVVDWEDGRGGMEHVAPFLEGLFIKMALEKGPKATPMLMVDANATPICAEAASLSTSPLNLPNRSHHSMSLIMLREAFWKMSRRSKMDSDGFTRFVLDSFASMMALDDDPQFEDGPLKAFNERDFVKKEREMLARSAGSGAPSRASKRI